MSWIMMPAVIALSLKLWLLAVAHKRKWADASWKAFVAIFVTHNLSELVLLGAAGEPEPAWLILRSYYMCSLFAMLYGLFYVSESANRVQRAACQLASGAVVMMVLLILFTDSVIHGHQQHSYSLSAIKGDAFILFRATALVIMYFTMHFLIANYRRTRCREHLYTICALIPLVVTTAVVVALIKTRFEINAVVVIPVASSLFLLITLQGKKVCNPDVLTLSFGQWVAAMRSRYFIIRHSIAYTKTLISESDRYHEVKSFKESAKPEAKILPLIKKARTSRSANDDLLR